MTDSESDHGDLSLDAIFPEPPRPQTPDPTISVYHRLRNTTKNHGEVTIRLVGSHPLWGNYLWNSAICLASYFEENESLCNDRSVLELGAGGGLPSIIASLNGARNVVITDYPDAALVNNMQHNVDHNISDEQVRQNIVVKVEIAVMLAWMRADALQGYIWGTPVHSLLDAFPPLAEGFDLIILSDLIFNHSQHDALLRTCERTLRPATPFLDAKDPCVLVFYTHHRPHLAHRDMVFFDKAREQGWKCDKIIEQKYPPMFPDDPGAEEVRSTVHGWRLSKSSTSVV
ncbi:hypothetical protein E1B28_013216 [Marasmius oreades]|uniref:Protein N-terminal and lysine N-methyltransferase EFM7 n=1 Tax=Marasmius oreades TaxID=181124 RepID=A0A9P7RQ32_9AGAR|nr:uncharacterized protein E1B28_013216 [Marasmius oreades]KAG7087235.1 hypothetical protein E1B28_013216 [Marasmius oreades]